MAELGQRCKLSWALGFGLLADCLAVHHTSGNDAEAEYDRLRDLARQEGSKRSSCFDRVRVLSAFRPLSA